MEKKMLLQTPKEMEREAFHKVIVADFLSLRKTYPTASCWRVFSEVARRHSLTAMGVMKICQKQNVYQTRKERNNG